MLQRTLRRLPAALLLLFTDLSVMRAQPWAPGLQLPTAEDASALEQFRRTGAGPDQRERYLRSAHDLLQRFWASDQRPKLLFAGDNAEGCGVKRVAHPHGVLLPAQPGIGHGIEPQTQRTQCPWQE